MVGDGPLFKEINKSLALSPWNSRISLTGRIDNPAEEYKKAHIFIACSPYENYSSLSFLEAMSYHLAIIATKVGETERIIENNINGLLVEPDPDSITKALHKLETNLNLIEEFGRRNQELIREKYSIEKMADRYQNVFMGVI